MKQILIIAALAIATTGCVTTAPKTGQNNGFQEIMAGAGFGKTDLQKNNEARQAAEQQQAQRAAEAQAAADRQAQLDVNRVAKAAEAKCDALAKASPAEKAKQAKMTMLGYACTTEYRGSVGSIAAQPLPAGNNKAYRVFGFFERKTGPGTYVVKLENDNLFDKSVRYVVLVFKDKDLEAKFAALPGASLAGKYVNNSTLTMTDRRVITVPVIQVEFFEGRYLTNEERQQQFLAAN